MDALIEMFKNVLLFAALAVPGFLMVKTKMVKAEQSGVLSKFVLYVGMPFLIVTGVSGIEFTRKFTTSLVVLSAFVVGGVLLTFFLSKPLTASEKDVKKQGMMRYCAIFSNCSFLAVPLAITMFGASSLVTAFVIVNNIIINLFMYTLGLYLISGDKKAVKLMGFLVNPITIGFAVGLIFNVTNLTDHVSEVADYCGYFSNTVTPLAMTVLGMKLGGIEWKQLFTQKRVYYVSLLRLIVFPVLVIAVAVACNVWLSLDADIVMAIFISFAMPSATSAAAFADTYAGDGDGAATYTLGSTIFSVATIPVLYGVLVALL